jgi:hypothetical protein
LKSWRDFRNPLSDRQAYLSKWGRGLCEELFRDGLSVVYPYYILSTLGSREGKNSNFVVMTSLLR